MRLYCDNIEKFIFGINHFYTVQENRFVKGKAVTLYSEYKECDFKIKHVLVMYNQETGEDDRVLHLEKIEGSEHERDVVGNYYGMTNPLD